MKIDILRPLQGQSDEIRALLAKTIRHTFLSEDVAESHANDLDNEIKNQWNNLARDFESGGILEHFLIAVDNRRIVGTIAYGPTGEIIRENLRFEAVNTPEVKCVYVLPDYHGKGIGSRLFIRMLETLQELAITEFCLDSGYRKAQHFWTNRLGAPTVVLTDYWCPDGHHMIWKRTVADVIPRK